MLKEPLKSLRAAHRRPSFPGKQTTVGTTPFLARSPQLAPVLRISSLKLWLALTQSLACNSTKSTIAAKHFLFPLHNTPLSKVCLPIKELHFFHLQAMSHFFSLTPLYVYCGCGKHGNCHWKYTSELRSQTPDAFSLNTNLQ